MNTTSGRACSPQEDTMESFAFAPGERLTALWLWSGPSGAGVPNYRAGAIRLSTSLVRALFSKAVQLRFSEATPSVSTKAYSAPGCR